MHRRDDHDPPVPGRAERRPGVAREQERAREEQRDERVPAVLVELLDRGDVLEARVRDDGVEPAEPLERGVDRGAVPVAGREVGLERLARPIGVRRDVDGEHVPAVADQPLRDRTADPAGRAGDECDLAHAVLRDRRGRR